MACTFKLNFPVPSGFLKRPLVSVLNEDPKTDMRALPIEYAVDPSAGILLPTRHNEINSVRLPNAVRRGALWQLDPGDYSIQGSLTLEEGQEPYYYSKAMLHAVDSLQCGNQSCTPCSTELDCGRLTYLRAYVAHESPDGGFIDLFSWQDNQAPCEGYEICTGFGAFNGGLETILGLIFIRVDESGVPIVMDEATAISYFSNVSASFHAPVLDFSSADPSDIVYLEHEPRQFPGVNAVRVRYWTSNITYDYLDTYALSGAAEYVKMGIRGTVGYLYLWADVSGPEVQQQNVSARVDFYPVVF